MPSGRPEIVINREEFESLCGIMCTLEEIAGVFQVYDTAKLEHRKTKGSAIILCTDTCFDKLGGQF